MSSLVVSLLSCNYTLMFTKDQRLKFPLRGVEYLPAKWQPYARLARMDRPIGTWLLLFPSWWSLVLAQPISLPLGLMALFALGAWVMRSAGCVYNDWVDRDLDCHVTRTAQRPLANRSLSPFQAWAFLLVLLLVGGVILVFLPVHTIYLGLASLILVLLYPWMKRITYWPQAFLGLTFNWGALMGWSAVHQTLASPAFFLYGAGIFWTLIYDTVYAHQDKEDDLRIGVKSSALRLQGLTKPFLILCGIAMITCLKIAGPATLTYGIALGVPASLLGWQIYKVNLNDPASCLQSFYMSRWIGWSVLIALLI